MDDVISIYMFDDADLAIMRSFIKSKEHGYCAECGSFLVDARILASSIRSFLGNFIDEDDEEVYEEDDLKIVVIHHSLIDLLGLVLREMLEPEPLFDARTDWAKWDRENKWRECEYFTWSEYPSYFNSLWVLFYNDKKCACFKKRKELPVEAVL